MKTTFICRVISVLFLLTIGCDSLIKETPDYSTVPPFSRDSKKWVSANITIPTPPRFVYSPSVAATNSTLKAWTTEIGGTPTMGLIRWNWVVEYTLDFQKYRTIKSVIQHIDQGMQSANETPNAQWRNIDDDISTLEYATVVREIAKKKKLIH